MAMEGGLGGRFLGCFDHEEMSLRVSRRKKVRGRKVESDEASMVGTKVVLAKAMEFMTITQKMLSKKLDLRLHLTRRIRLMGPSDFLKEKKIKLKRK